jgi:hypothetical protein
MAINQRDDAIDRITKIVEGWSWRDSDHDSEIIKDIKHELRFFDPED